MKHKILILTALLLTGFSASGWTAMADDAEATIRLMEASEAEDSSEVTRVISLPDHLLNEDSQAKAVEKAEKGLHTATENVNKNELPSSASEQARDARDAAGDMSENAMENRANRGRSGDRPQPPDRPQTPEPPSTPGGG
jgi:hypothetical protein